MESPIKPLCTPEPALSEVEGSPVVQAFRRYFIGASQNDSTFYPTDSTAPRYCPPSNMYECLARIQNCYNLSV